MRTIECTACGRPMRITPSAQKNLAYYSCDRCGTRMASLYDEVLRSGAAVRIRESDACGIDEDRLARIVARAEAWFARLEAQSPYHVLGLPDGSDLPTVRARYHELAGKHHPDIGGDEGRMREVIDAYRQIRARAA